MSTYMETRRPLYYPYMAVSDPHFMAQCLLLWDGVRCINPFAANEWDQIEIAVGGARKGFVNAIERFNDEFVVRALPTEQDLALLKAWTERSFAGPVFAALDPRQARSEDLVTVHKRKLGLHVISGLVADGWAHPLGGYSGVTMHKATATRLLHALADIMNEDDLASTVTDDVTAYLERQNLEMERFEESPGRARSGPAQGGFLTDNQFSAVVALVLEVPAFRARDLSEGTLNALMDLHQEAAYTEHRRAFGRRVEELLRGFRQERIVEKDALEMLLQEIGSDRDALRAELRQARIEHATTPAVMTAFFTAGAAYVAPAIGVAAAVVGAVAALPNGFVRWRRDAAAARSRHWTAWLTRHPRKQEKALLEILSAGARSGGAYPNLGLGPRRVGAR